MNAEQSATLCPPEEALGELLVREGCVTRPQLNHALHIQKRQIARERIGDLLVKLSYARRRDVREVVEETGKRELFGQMLLHQGVIEREQLDEALREQRRSHRRIGEILIEKNLIDEEKLARALARQLDVAYVVPQPHLVNMDVFQRLSESFMRENCALPMSESRGVITVLVSDPTDPLLKPRLEEKLRAAVQLAVGIKANIRSVVESMLLQKQVSNLASGGLATEEGQIRSVRRLVVRTSDMTRGLAGSAANVFDYLVWDALRQGASDIHVEPRRERLEVRYRLDGVLTRQAELPFALALPMFKRAEVLARLDTDSIAPYREGPIQAQVDKELVDLRVAITTSVLGKSMVVRLFPRTTGLMKIEDIGMPPRMLETYLDVLSQTSGLTLLVGPKSCGKTTSLYSTLRHFNDMTKKIVTLESPVAFALDGIVQHNASAEDMRDIGTTLSHMLQLDPDILALGDVATRDAAEEVLRCAIMGQKVFATMHAEDCATALLRFEHIPDVSTLMRSCSIVVVAQRLVRKVCENCSQDAMPPADLLREFRFAQTPSETARFRYGQGCASCRGAGYLGRTGIFELLVVNPEIREALLRTPPAGEIRRLARKSPSFLSLRQAGLLKACQGVTTLEEVRRVVPAAEGKAPGEETETYRDLLDKAGLGFETA